MASKPTTVIIPAFNEGDIIRTTLEGIIAEGFHEKYEVIVVDDGSEDQTAEIIREYPVRLLKHHTNKGYGAALKTGIRAAKGDVVIIMDSDGQHDPGYIPQVETLMGEYDMVIGDRSKSSYQASTRKAGKRLIRWVGEYVVEQKLPDYNSGFRGFHRATIEGMLHMMPNGFSFSTTSTLAYLKEGYNVGTIEMEVYKRKGRKSNVRMFRDGSKTMLLLFRIIMLFNPLKVFFPTSLVTFLLGIVFGIIGYMQYARFSNGAVVLTTLGMFLFFIGLVSDQISIMNRRRS